MIDLHSHTTASDGTCSPEDLIALACATGIRTLAITDHDTLAGYDAAVDAAARTGLELVCGIELSVKFHAKSVHLLGYFPHGATPSFRDWILTMQEARRDRNRRLVARLQELGLSITLEEVEARGRGMTGRPHFAQVLLEKGYVSTLQQAFDDYLDESAKAYVYRQEPQFAEAVSRIRDAGGISSLAHPVRVHGDVRDAVREMCAVGLQAIEAYHSDHSPELTALYLDLAREHGLLVTGGSDFHGANKPELKLGTGRAGNVQVPDDVWDRLRQNGDSTSH